MKNILLFIFFSFLYLSGAKSMDDTFQKNERAGVETVLQKENSSGYVLSSIAELPPPGDAYVDSESLARQFRICGRGHRSLSVQHVLVNKGAAYRFARKRLELLFHSIHRIYTSLPLQSWAVSSLHYVFELRRILI